MVSYVDMLRMLHGLDCSTNVGNKIQKKRLHSQLLAIRFVTMPASILERTVVSGQQSVETLQHRDAQPLLLPASTAENTLAGRAADDAPHRGMTHQCVLHRDNTGARISKRQGVEGNVSNTIDEEV